MNDRTEAATESRIDTLREEGIVPVSFTATHYLGVTALLLSCCALWSTKDFVRFTEQCLDFQDLQCRTQMHSVVVTSIKFLMIPIAMYSLAALVSALLQTKFFFRVRLAPVETLRGAFWRISLIKLLLGALLAGGVILVIIASFFSSISTLFNGLSLSAYTSFYKDTGGLLKVFCFFCAGFAGIAGAFFWIMNQLLFRRRHRMTRAQVLRESQS